MAIDSRIPAVIAAAVVLISIAGAGCVSITGGHDPYTHYAILDNPEESVRAGLVVDTQSNITNVKAKVVSITDDGLAEYVVHAETIRYYGFEKGFDIDDTYRYFPDFLFDDSARPEGVTVTDKGNGVYTVDGVCEVDDHWYGTIFCRYTNDTVTLDADGDITDVEGGFSFTMYDETSTYLIGGVLETVGTDVDFRNFKAVVDTHDIISKAKFVEDEFSTYDPEEFEGADVVSGEVAKVGGRICETRTVNGLTYGLEEYKDFTIYSYKGFVVKCTGMVDGMVNNITTNYYYE